MSQAREVRDPIHGFIRLRGRECDLVDTPVFQRLRRVHQLAMAFMVYPGALHTRFDHTLGVTEVAGRMCERLRVDDDHTRVVRLAALLHDLGHGPFSHVSESVLDALSEPGLEKAAGKKEKIHEMITQKIILQHPQLSPALSQRDREEVMQLLKSGMNERIHRDIISGPLDADKQDYLLRDSRFCGVTYGLYDIDQLHQTLCGGRENSDCRLMVTENGVHALEQFVLAKYYLTTQVYRHKVRLITDQMLVRAIRLAVEVDKIKPLDALYRYRDTDEYISNYLDWDDQRLTVELLKPEYENSKSGGMFRRLVNRQLWKLVFRIPIGHQQFEGSLVQTALPEEFPQIRDDLEKEVATELSK
ncbi:MAG TPA: HD domain-containing protein [Terrimicrobiaceae bacterium]